MKNHLWAVVLAAIVLLVSQQGFAKDLYVAPTGSDSVGYDANSIATPWATPHKAWAEARPGDVVYFRGGTYVLTATIDTQSMGYHGTAEAPITFTSYPGETATVDCAAVWTGFSIQKNHNTIRNLRFINYATCFQIGYQEGGDYTEILDCTGIANRQGGADNVGFVVSRNRTSHIRVQNNRIIGPGRDLNPNTAGVLVFGCRQLKILNNEFSDLPMGIFYKHPNLVAAQAETDIEYAYNYFTNCANAIPTAACYAHIHNNISGVNGGSISSGLDGGMPAGTSFGDYCLIEHNTIHASPLLVEGSPGIGFSYSERGYDANGQPYDPLRGATHNQIRNNIIMANHRAHAYGPPRDINGNPIANYNYANSYDYNMYHNRVYTSGIGHPFNYAIAVQDGVSYATLAAWRAKNGGDQHSIAANPLFVGGEAPSTIAGFALAAGSPGKNAGSDGRDMGADVTRVGIQTSRFTITSPNGGEAWRRGETRQITWTATGVTESLVIDLMQGPTLLGVIATGVAPTSGSYAWTVGQMADGTYRTGTGLKIRIRTSSGRMLAQAALNQSSPEVKAASSRAYGAGVHTGVNR